MELDEELAKLGQQLKEGQSELSNIQQPASQEMLMEEGFKDFSSEIEKKLKNFGSGSTDMFEKFFNPRAMELGVG